ncbi:hypothetical protein LOD99_3683 [Oopsacas minuta]|uniref:Uncharacterized protein n=1 Tax=Oopsacas minuta TaxID=111878 RepID=A0AAV7JYB2_9METZ|nr:hypothetical protein LOD99_3683 [Oopsacas minuta]
MPLCVVENSSVLLLVHSLNDRYTVASSYKLRKGVNVSIQAMEKLISSSRIVTLTIDGYSSRRGEFHSPSLAINNNEVEVGKQSCAYWNDNDSNLLKACGNEMELNCVDD